MLLAEATWGCERNGRPRHGGHSRTERCSPRAGKDAASPCQLVSVRGQLRKLTASPECAHPLFFSFTRQSWVSPSQSSNSSFSVAGDKPRGITLNHGQIPTWAVPSRLPKFSFHFQMPL